MDGLKWTSDTSDLLFQRHNDFHSHVEYPELCLGFVCLQVSHAHATELLQRFVDVSYPNPAINILVSFNVLYLGPLQVCKSQVLLHSVVSTTIITLQRSIRIIALGFDISLLPNIRTGGFIKFHIIYVVKSSYPMALSNPV